MIKHHPSDEILNAYVQAELPVSVSVAVAIHTELCSTCAQKVDDFTAMAASKNLTNGEQQATVANDILAEQDEVLDSFEFDFDEMLDAITCDTSQAAIGVVEEQTITVAGKSIPMPRAMSKLDTSDWLKLGKLNRSRIALDDGALRTSMLYIENGGVVPHHTHNGFEITLLLDGSFSDDMGEYHKGDFIWLDGSHKHQPETQDGCLCYTVVSDSLKFSQGLSRLLNPIGKLIY